MNYLNQFVIKMMFLFMLFIICDMDLESEIKIDYISVLCFICCKPVVDPHKRVYSLLTVVSLKHYYFIWYFEADGLRLKTTI